jgi:Na+/proline symporter
MSPSIILITVIAYIVVLFTISYFAGHKADNAGFFTGNRQSKWYMVAFAMIGASISGVTFVSVPGMVAVSGFGYLQLVMGFIVGQLIIAFVLTPLFYRMHLTSIYQYLSDRFGMASYHTGAWFFFVSKMLGAAVRLFLVCITLQLLAFGPLGIPFWVNVVLSVGLVWLYTFRGGVKSIIWTDSLKTLCLIVSVGLCIYFIAHDMNFSFGRMLKSVAGSSYSKVFFFNDVNDKEYFFKQFLAGIFTMVAMNGLDQDMMQRNLSCRNYHESQKNMIISILLQFVVVATFLVLGVLLYIFAAAHGITATGDKLFPVIATGDYLPVIVGVLFIIGFVASAYNAAGSALTALTTSFTVDILGIKDKSEKQVSHIRGRVHVGMALLMVFTIIIFNILNNTSVIDAVYILASYTYGPILGLFAFGIIVKRPVRDKLVPFAALAAPCLCLILDMNSERWFNGYHFSYEILIFNALFTFIGMCFLIKGKEDKSEKAI